jgi:hypothetical protein
MSTERWEWKYILTLSEEGTGCHKSEQDPEPREES